MVSRLLSSILLLSCGLAHADEVQTELVPSCAEIDAQHDELSAELRTRVVQRLTRVLEREQLLVVTNGCVDRYVVSHEQGASGFLVRVAGPHGTRRARNVPADELERMYVRMIESLLSPPPPVLESRPAPEAAPVNDDADASDASGDDHDEEQVETAALEPDASNAESDEPTVDALDLDAVQIQPDRILYGQLSVGSNGGGWGMGYRRHAAEHVAMDASLSYVENNMSSALAFGVEALYVPHPRESMTTYVGGGLSLADEKDNSMTGGGLRAELTAGLSFSRGGVSRWFTQFDAALPMFAMKDYDGRSSYRPSVAFSVGLGF